MSCSRLYIHCIQIYDVYKRPYATVRVTANLPVHFEVNEACSYIVSQMC
jgi:hypothetical protein